MSFSEFTDENLDKWGEGQLDLIKEYCDCGNHLNKILFVADAETVRYPTRTWTRRWFRAKCPSCYATLASKLVDQDHT